MSKIVWRDWNPQGVKASVAEQVAKDMEVACKLVETQARANLMSISTPASGRGYRRKVLAPRVKYEIEMSKDFVEGRVGILRGRHNEYHGAYYIEIGTRRYPAHPWLRPAVFNNAREIMLIIAGK
jgi:hypothetical protein